MTLFEKYREPIKLSGDSEPLSYKAYRLDGCHPNPDLRCDAAVGSCNCCDYFFFSCENLVLIEDTRLISDIRRKKDEYDYLRLDDSESYIRKQICLENVLKVYGSLFVLYRYINRYISRYSDLNLAPKIGSIQFWFVINDAQKEHTRVFDKFKDPLNQEFSARLGKMVINKVVLMTKRSFISKCESESDCDAVSGLSRVQR